VRGLDGISKNNYEECSPLLLGACEHEWTLGKIRSCPEAYHEVDTHMPGLTQL